MKSIIDALKKSRIFKGRPDETLSGIADQCEIREFQQGETVLGPDSCTKALGIIAAGKLRVSRREDGKTIPINTLADGDCFGVVNLFDDGYAPSVGFADTSLEEGGKNPPLPPKYIQEVGGCHEVTGGVRPPAPFTDKSRIEIVMEVTAQTKASVVYLSQDIIENLIHEDPKIRMNYIAFLTDRIRFLNSKVRTFTGGGAASRLAGELIRMQSGEKITVPGYSELARKLDIGRASLYRALEELEQGGYISRNGKTIEILDENLKG